MAGVAMADKKENLGPFRQWYLTRIADGASNDDIRREAPAAKARLRSEDYTIPESKFPLPDSGVLDRLGKGLKSELSSIGEMLPIPKHPGATERLFGPAPRTLREPVPHLDDPWNFGEHPGAKTPEYDPLNPGPSIREDRAALLGDKAANWASFGTAPQLMDAMGVGLGPDRRKALEADPNVNTGPVNVAAAVPSLLYGGPAMLDRGIRGVAGLAGQAAKNPIVRTATGAASGYAGDAAQQVGETMDIKSAANASPWSAVLGGSADALGAAFDGVRRVAHGPADNPTWPGQYRDAVDSGAYQHPALESGKPPAWEGVTGPTPQEVARSGVAAGRAPAMRDAQEAAVHSARKGVFRDAEMASADKKVYQEELGPYQDTAKVDAAAVLQDIRAQKLANINPATGKPKSPDLETALTEVEDMFLPTQGDTYGPNPLVNPTYRTVAQLRTLNREASKMNAAARTDKQELAGVKYGILRDAIHKHIVDPKAKSAIVAAEGKAKANADASRRRKDILTRTEENVVRPGGPREMPMPDMSPDDLGLMDTDAFVLPQMDQPSTKSTAGGTIRVPVEQATTRFMRRVGDDNVPGKDVRVYHEELGGMDPELEAAQQLVRDVKAHEGTRFGFKPLLPLDLHGAAEGGGKGAVMRQNIRALYARLLDPAMGLASKGLPKAARMTPMLRDPLDAIMGGEQERKKK